MNGRAIDAILGSPPEREELIVQLFHRDGPLMAEVFRESGEYWIAFLDESERPLMRINADELVSVIQRSLVELRNCHPEAG